MKKILMLGGANSQIPAIKKAKELGYYVITCDYLPENPGHVFSDEYVNVSTTDKDAILKVAKEKNVDGIIAYASDPSAPSAAYVVDELDLYGATGVSTCILAEKDKFRMLQKANGFNVPKFVVLSNEIDLDAQYNQIPIPCIVKPVDSSGSKGISKVYKQSGLKIAFEYAYEYSRAKRVIFEEIIDSPYCQLHGEGFVYDNKLIFMELGDQRFRNNVPIGSSCPSKVYIDNKVEIWNIVEAHLQAAGFSCGGLNIEVRIGEDGKIYVIEIGPRTGGNYVPQLMEASTGFDEMTPVLQVAMGDYKETPCIKYETRNCFQYIIGSEKTGIYKDVWISDEIRQDIEYLYLHKKAGDQVYEYENSSGVVGVAIIHFETYDKMEKIINNIRDYIKVIVEEE